MVVYEVYPPSQNAPSGRTGMNANRVPFESPKERKRNISDYERAGAVSKQEAKEMFVLAKTLRDEVEKWLRSNHPKFL